MANTIDALMKTSYALGVNIFRIIAEYIGISYLALNVIVFCIIGPLVFFVMLFIIIQMHYKLKYKVNIVDK